jgi:tetratricopeptide (TPR) repeat protein
VAPDSHTEDSAVFLQGLGVSYYYQHQFAKAEEAYRLALDIRMKSPAADAYSVASLLSNLAAVYQVQRRYGEAKVMLSKAREWPDAGLREDYGFQAALLANIAAMSRNEGRFEEAEETYRKAVELLPDADDKDGKLTVTLLNNFAVERMRHKAWAEAADSLARAVTRLETGTALSRTDVTQILDHYRLCLRKTGNNGELRRLDARAKIILSMTPRQATDGLTIDVSQLGPPR